jgi:hypothetical protein
MLTIRKLDWGIDFLGYIVLPHYLLPRTKTKRRIFRKLREKINFSNYKDAKIVLGMQKVGYILKGFKSDEDKYISQEFQKYGYELAKELGDLKNKSLYIKLAKDTSRGFLEAARNFIKDAYQVKNRPALFLWKLKQLKNQSVTIKL